jgi:integrase/recombinase XerD
MAERAESKELVIPWTGAPTPPPMPAAAIIVLRQTPNAAIAAEDFFKATLSNEHTRRAYGRIAGRFLSWCNDHGLDLRQITPGLAGEYLSQLPGSAPTKNQALAALRHFFDALVQRHAVALNPFASVRGTKYSVTEGKTAELAIEQARKLFKSIDTSHVVGLRDRAVLGVLAYTGPESAQCPNSGWPITGIWAITACCASGKKAARTGRSLCVTTLPPG